MQFELTVEDYTIILNALHYYKKAEKYPNFAHFHEVKDQLAERQIGLSDDSKRKDR